MTLIALNAKNLIVDLDRDLNRERDRTHAGVSPIGARISPRLAICVGLKMQGEYFFSRSG